MSDGRISKKIKQGKIDIDAEQCALVIHFEVETVRVDGNGRPVEVLNRNPETRRIKMISISEDKNLGQMSEDIVEKCKYIHPSRVEEVEQQLIRLQKATAERNKVQTAQKQEKQPSKVKHINTIQKFMNGDGMTPEDTDLIMNTIALINALVLTIPYSLSGSLDNNYWDWIQETLNSSSCTDYVEKNCPSGPGACFHTIFTLVQNNLYCTVYASITALGISFAYYLMRPKCIDDNDENKRKVVHVHYIYTNKPEGLEMSDRKILQTIHQDSGIPDDKKEKDDFFLNWWIKGKYVILIVVLSTLISVVTVLNLYAIVAKRYVTSTSRFCVDSSRSNVAISVGVFIFCATLVFSMYLMY